MKREDLAKTQYRLEIVRAEIKRLKKELQPLEDELIHLKIREELLSKS